MAELLDHDQRPWPAICRMAVQGQIERFPPLGLSARYVIEQETFGGASGDEKVLLGDPGGAGFNHGFSSPCRRARTAQERHNRHSRWRGIGSKPNSGATGKIG
jgi:hypothetical protein